MAALLFVTERVVLNTRRADAIALENCVQSLVNGHRRFCFPERSYVRRKRQMSSDREWDRVTSTRPKKATEMQTNAETHRQVTYKKIVVRRAEGDGKGTYMSCHAKETVEAQSTDGLMAG